MPDSSDRFTIRRMRREDLDIAVGWALAEGWNPGLHDAGCFFGTDTEGFFIGELDGRPIGSISAVAYGEGFGFVGFYIVTPEERGKGYGIRLWRTAMESLGERNVGLDGVLARQDDYTRSGFRLAYKNYRHRGVGGGTEPEGVAPLGAVPFDMLLAYDSACFPARRERFLRSWIDLPGAAGRAVMEDGALRGYGMIRPCREGWKIGPLFADDVSTADRIYRALAAHVPGQSVFLDIPEVNDAAGSLARRNGMEPVFATVRMYTKAAPDIALGRVFGVTTFELG